MAIEASLAETFMNLSVFGIDVSALSQWALIIIMVSMGLTLEPSQFKHLLRNPRPVVVGLAGQLIVLPAMAFLIALGLGVAAPVAMGLVILACCPSAATSNFFSYLARGDVALSVALTAVSGLVVVFTIPLWVNLGSLLFIGEAREVHLPLVNSMVRIFSMVVLPVAAGMLVRRIGPVLVGRIQPYATAGSFLMIIVMMAILLVAIAGQLPELLAEAGPATLLLNVSMMAFGFAGARLLKLGERQSRSICIEIGVQNFVLAVVIAAAMLQRPDFIVVPAIYLFTMYLTVFPFIGYCRWIRDARRASIKESEVNEICHL